MTPGPAPRGAAPTFRTPEERFAGLPDFPWQPHYADWDGLRLARIDEGDGEPVVLVHGEPTWSLLWRHVIPPLLAGGHRCIAPDLPGFGRSDKPTDPGWYTYERLVEALGATLDDAGVAAATFVLHDWGGPIGLRLAAERPELCSRLVLLDTGIFDGRQRMSDAWQAFRGFVENTPDLPVSTLVRGGCASDPGEAVGDAYDAPFPSPESKAAARALPLLIPMDPQDPGAAEGARAAELIATQERPSLVLWAEGDPIIPPAAGAALATRLGLSQPQVIAGASHFLQEDQGPEVGTRIAAWLATQR